METTMRSLLKLFSTAASLALLAGTVLLPISAQGQDNPVVIMETNKGTIKIELWADKAPISAANFLRYTDAEFYDGLIFHRVIEGFMVQGGGFNEDMVQQSPFESIKNEASAELPNNRGTLAMARTNVIDSATSQFFINLVNNEFLNHKDETSRGFGYAVFGEVIEGMEVVDAIATVSTGRARGHQNVPKEAIKMISVRRQ
jgi:cyclophilin family peptidyl-prolyl cis-trans isomerase